MSEKAKLPVEFTDYKGAVHICVRYDDEVINMRQGASQVLVPECPVEPLVTMQKLDNGGKGYGTVWVLKDGDWHSYIEGTFPIPSSEAAKEEAEKAAKADKAKADKAKADKAAKAKAAKAAKADKVVEELDNGTGDEEVTETLD